MADRSGLGLPHCRGFTITFRHTTFGRTPLDCGTRNSSKRAAADPCLRPRGRWDRRLHKIMKQK
jgi:hypothetical protein